MASASLPLCAAAKVNAMFDCPLATHTSPTRTSATLVLASLPEMASSRGAALAGLAGVIAGPILGVYSGVDVEVLIPAFIVIVVGGMGSLKGAFVGSIVIGMADTFGKAYLPETAMFLTYVAMILILLVRPGGLFGQVQPR